MDVSVINLEFFQTLRKNIFLLPPIFLFTADGPAAKSSDVTSSKAPLKDLPASAQNPMAWDASRRKQRVVILFLFMITSRIDSRFFGREIKESSDENLSHLSY
jgi:hypothetical protein